MLFKDLFVIIDLPFVQMCGCQKLNRLPEMAGPVCPVANLLRCGTQTGGTGRLLRKPVARSGRRLAWACMNGQSRRLCDVQNAGCIPGIMYTELPKYASSGGASVPTTGATLTAQGFRLQLQPMESTVRSLQGISLFAELPDSVLSRIAEVAIRRSYEAGETIVFEQDLCQAAYFVTEGQVRLYRMSPAGRVQVLALLGPGTAFNLVPLFAPRATNHTTAQALTGVAVYAITGDDLHRLVNECAELALAIVREFAVQLDRLTDLVEDLALRSVRGRLARFLLENAERAGVAQRWTQEDIAAHLGTVRDMVGRTLRAFADEELVRMQRQRIILLDRQGLETEAGL